MHEVVFVGEQPGDQEDIAGKPFVGPAGKVFDAILEEAGIDRLKVYVTNAVKHFKFEPRGKRRIHSKPNAGEIQACRWWLDKELALIKPDLVVALGATAAQSLLGKAVPITKMRGEVIEREDGLRVFLTIHPSFILRIREREDKEAERQRFLEDMKAVKKADGGVTSGRTAAQAYVTSIALRSLTLVPVGPGTNRSPTALNAVQASLPASIALASTPAARMRATVEPSAKAPALSSDPSMPSVSAASAWMPVDAVDADREGQQELAVAAALALGAQRHRGLAARQDQHRLPERPVAAGHLAGDRGMHRADVARLALDRIRQDHRLDALPLALPPRPPPATRRPRR